MVSRRARASEGKRVSAGRRCGIEYELLWVDELIEPPAVLFVSLALRGNTCSLSRVHAIISCSTALVTAPGQASPHLVALSRSIVRVGEAMHTTATMPNRSAARLGLGHPAVVQCANRRLHLTTNFWRCSRPRSPCQAISTYIQVRSRRDHLSYRCTSRHRRPSPPALEHACPELHLREQTQTSSYAAAAGESVTADSGAQDGSVNVSS